MYFLGLRNISLGLCNLHYLSFGLLDICVPAQP
jgi:hypothetical protein